MNESILPHQVLESSTAIPAIILGLYLLLLLGIGLWGYRKGESGEEDYYLAGRNQGWLISTLTIMATFLSSFALLGAPGMVYREGVVFALVAMNVPVAGICVFVLGKRIWKIGKARGYITQADMFCDYYNGGSFFRILIVFVGMLFVVPYVMMQIKAGGDLAAVMFPDFSSSFDIGAVVLAMITAVYIMFGGMRSVALTDAIQCVLLIGAMALAGISIVEALGGIEEFSQAVSHLPKRSLTLPGNTGQWSLPFLFTVCIFMPIGGIIQPAQWMRFYAAKDASVLSRGAIVFIVLLTGCYLFGIMLVGLGGAALYPLVFTDVGVQPAPEIGDFDQILVFILNDRLPHMVGVRMGQIMTSLVIVAIMAASMSTADSNLHALSALITRDVYERFLRSRASQKERVWIGRLVVLIATCGSLAIVLTSRREGSSLTEFVQMIVGLALFAVAFSVQLLPMTLDVLFVRRGTRAGALSGLVVGLIVAFMFTSLFPLLCGEACGLTAIVQTMMSTLPMHASAWGVAANVIVFALVSASPRSIRQRKPWLSNPAKNPAATSLESYRD